MLISRSGGPLAHRELCCPCSDVGLSLGQQAQFSTGTAGPLTGPCAGPAANTVFGEAFCHIYIYVWQKISIKTDAHSLLAGHSNTSAVTLKFGFPRVRSFA